MNIIDAIEKESLNPNVPQFAVGNTVKVFFKVIEGSKERIQAYEGTVIARKHGGL
ncbi:MAG: 50S ribosomal protein L19, partial [Clostridia bacterium]